MKPKKPFWKRSPKSAIPAPRSREEIQDAYNRACNEAGDLQYKLVSMSERLNWLTKFRGQLNEELVQLEHNEQVLRERVMAEHGTEDLPTAPPPPAEEQN